jgi:hypothetical protein
VNRIIWHGTPYNTFGSDTVSFYATVHVGKAGALSGHLASFNEYLTEVSRYMDKGEVYSDVAVYLPLEDSWIAGELPKEKQLPWAWGEYEFRYQVVPEEIRGYQPLWINGKFLSEGKGYVAENNGLVVGDCRFSSLYVDAVYLDYEVLKTMVELAEEGLPVCLKQKPEEAGYFQHVEFEPLATRLVGLSSPDWTGMNTSKPLVEGDDLPFFWCRKADHKYYLFFAHPVAREFRYPVKYGQADTDRVEIRNVRINLEKKSIDIRLEFDPYESLLLEIGSKGKYRFINLPSFR